MKKSIKVLALVIAVVMVLSILAGCSLFGKEMAKYRNQTMLIVGNEPVSVGVVMDQFNNYYYNYSSYISSGYMTLNDLFSTVMDSIYTLYSKVDSYKNDVTTVKYTEEQNPYIKLGYYSAEYLTKSEMEYVLQYVKYGLFTSFDIEVNNYIALEIGKMPEETEETDDRAFYEYDDMGTAKTYAEKLYNDSITSEEMNEYYDKYYNFAEFDRNSADYNDYVFANAQQAQARVDYINEQLKQYVIDEEGEKDEYPTITAEKYIEYQNKAIKKLNERVTDTYGADLSNYFVERAESSIITIISYKWDLKQSSVIEQDQAALIDTLTQRYNNAKDAFTTSINANVDNYITFIEGLSDTSYIYNVPTLYKDSYIFVKNLLIPFSDAQKAKLANYATILGSTTSEEYIKVRNQLAAEIVAKDFNNDEAEVSGLFTYDAESNKIQLAGELASALPNDGSVTPESFVELMKRFNTDTAQHSALYEYVVRVDETTPSDYQSKWVQEFVDAALEAKQGGLHNYGIAVSEYGVHIVYYSSDVTAWDSFDSSRIYDTKSNEYRFLKSYYESVQTNINTEAVEKLNDEYRYAGKIKVVNSELQQLLKDFGVSYDFNAAMVKPEEDTEE